jgi:hypothetical protein
MATKADLPTWVVESLKAEGGSAKLVRIAKGIWDRHEPELRASGDLFYTWQYDMRWAANNLRRNKIMRSEEMSAKGVWELA